MADLKVSGFAAEPFGEIADLFASRLEGGGGASFSVTVEGEAVVDLWGGWKDAAGQQPWTEDTLVCVYSSTKTVTALVVLLLADRGLLDFDTPVARYWPEFGQNGKADITVAQVLSHASGLSGWDTPISVTDLYDWDKATSLLAAQAPAWEPGTAPGYHAVTQGFLIGEVVRRVTGASLGSVFAREIAQPCGVDFFIGLPESEDSRAAELTPPPPQPPFPPEVLAALSPITLSVLSNPPTNPLDTRDRRWRAAEIPAANGYGNARSLAKAMAILANGGMAGSTRVLSEGGCRRAFVQQIEGVDLVLGIPAHYSLGFGMAPMMPLPSDASIFWGGFGGSLVMVDPKARATYAFAMNVLSAQALGDPRGLGLAQAAWAIVNRMSDQL